MLVRQGQMLHQSQAVPRRRQYWPPKLLLGETFQDAEDMIPLRVEEIQQYLSLVVPQLILVKAVASWPRAVEAAIRKCRRPVINASP